MTLHAYEQFVAIDASGTRAAFAAFNAYAPSDTTFSTPLAVADASGVPMVSIDANAEGTVQPYQVDGYLFVVLKSGSYIFPRVSAQGLVDEVTAASAAAAQALADLRQYVTDHPGVLPATGKVPGKFLGVDGSGVEAWLDAAGLSGTVSWNSIEDKPSLAPADHTHTSSNITDATAVGRSVMKAADKPAARAAIDAAPSSTVSFPGFGVAADVAARGNHTHGAATIPFDSAGTGLVADNVQDAIEEAALTGGAGGSSEVVVYTYRSGAYPTLPATKPPGAKRALFQGPVAPTSYASWMGLGSTQVPTGYEYMPTT